MDWITHYMVAFILGRKLGLNKEGMMAITLGALVLDFDVILYLLPGSLSHGTLTHTAGGMLVLGAVSTLAMYGWKKKMLGTWIGLGLASHILLDMVNTLSFFDPGKRLFYPISGSVYSLESFAFINPLAIWATITAALFSISLVMLITYASRGDMPWRVWYDERPLVAYWRGKLGARD
ncbi:MAG: metal-dependent hydrolase [Thermoplasmata archaeon]